jgi:methionyl-tRNA formyltransferase
MNSCLILFDKFNKTNFKFFSLKRLKSKIKKKIYIKLSFKKDDIKNFKYIFLIGFTRKITLDNKKKFYTVHESNLPKGRGHSPIKWQIIKGKKIITATLFKLNESVDSGKILLQEKIYISKTDLFSEIKKKQILKTEKLIAKFISNYKNIKEKKQSGKPTYYPKLSEKEDKIDPNKSLISQFDIIRSTNPKYANYFILGNKKFIIKIKKF